MPSNKPDDQFTLIDQIKTIPSKRKYLLISVGLTVGLAILVGLIVVIVAFTSEKSGNIVPPIDPIKLEDRVDCLPWMKNKSEHLIEQECRKLNRCIFDPAEEEPEAPLCFYNMTEIKLKLENKIETPMGMDLIISGGLINGSLLIRIEFYDNYALRMKVCKN